MGPYNSKDFFRGGLCTVKIHIVQKGDTLWKIAQKYGVDFNELKHVNTQLSNPDMIMPGMKIKIPTGSVPVKKQGNPYTKEEVSFSHLVPKEMPKQVSPVQMPLPTPVPVAPKEMPQQIIPTPVVPKEMPVPQSIPKEVPKEAPIVQLPPMPPMPIEQPEIDYNIEQNMYNYTFNIPTFPTMPQKEAPVKEMPEVVAGVSTEEPVAPPTMPAQPMPQAPASYPCVPMTGLMPGTGLPFGYQPMPCPPFPCPPVAVPYGMQPGMYNPAGFGAMPEMQGTPYTPQPTAVSPAMFDDEGNDGSEQMYPGLAPISAPVAPINAPIAPIGQMAAAGGDCGCGGPKMGPVGYGGGPIAGYGGIPTTGYGSMPAGFSGVPAAGYGGIPMPGYGGVPVAGYGGIPAVGYGGIPPAGYGGAPGTGYGGAPAGFSGVPTTGYGGIPTTGYGGVPSGYGGAPVGNMGVPTGYGGMPTTGFGATPAGFGAPQTGLPGTETQAPQGAFAPPEFPFAQFQTQMSPTNIGEPPFRFDDIDDEEDDW